jgi:hypothetical protein
VASAVVLVALSVIGVAVILALAQKKAMPKPRELLKGEVWSSRYAAALKKISRVELEKDMGPVFSLSVIYVVRNLQADQNGLKKGDCIAAFDGVPVRGISAVPFQRRGGRNRVEVWSGNEKKTVTFEPGAMGLSFTERWCPELAYLRGNERNAAWDDLLLVAAWEYATDPELAETALFHAHKAGYKGWMLPALMAVVSAWGNRPDLALAYGYLSYSTTPEHSLQPILATTCGAALEECRLEVLRELTEKYPQYHIADDVDQEELLKRARALSPAEQSAISSSGARLRTIKTDLTSQAQCENLPPVAVANLRRGGPLTANCPAGQKMQAAVGPGLENPAIILDMSFSDAKPLQEKWPPYFELDLVDISYDVEGILAKIWWDTRGNLSWWISGYSHDDKGGQKTCSPNCQNRAEIYLNGRLCEIRFNGERLALGLLPGEKRKVLGFLNFHGIQARVGKVTFAELSPIAPLGAPAASTAGAVASGAPPGVIQIPERPAAPSEAWFYDMTVGAYLAHGRRNPAWDLDAVEAARLTARYWADEAIDAEDILDKTRSAIAAGCDDPLILLIHGQMLGTIEGSSPQQGRFLTRAAAELQNSAYPAYVRFRALTLSYARCVDSLVGSIKQRSLQDARTAVALLPELLNDPNASKASIRKLLLDYAVPPDCGTSLKIAGDAYELYCAALARVDGGESIAQTVKGAYYIDYAWLARGGGWASTVTQEGWKLFGERLKVAAECLQDAIRMDPSNDDALARMITVCKGQSRPRAEMDGYLQQAIEANPNGLTARLFALDCLMPRWGGSHKEMVELTDQCLQQIRDNPKATPWLVKVRVQMHRDFANDLYFSTEDHLEGQTLENMYWMLPGVWNDLEQTFELALKRSPHSRLLKSDYASWAVRCEQWPVADRLLTELGDGAAPSSFGGLYEMRCARLKARAMTAALNEPVK